ncbi:MAG TPA: radical SAM protein [Ruminococcaceae bacterium]|mgnify:FL=1|nr:radical SAM protein [Oscillospiraceae bacterium]
MFICNQCPRRCGADRDIKTGVCGVNTGYKVARAALHYWEEPCISGENGSGTVFFSGCSLKCVYCQNYKVSSECYGKEITKDRLIEIFKELEAQGANNINLVNPTHYAVQLASTLSKYKPSVPVVYNTGGYDSVESLKLLDGLVDIYLTDMKYVSPSVSLKYSKAADYFDVCSAAVREMKRQQGTDVFENGLMKKGLIIRHLVLPGNVSQAMRTLDWIKDNLPIDTVISLMGQYMPCAKAAEYPTINRKLSEKEYNIVLDYAEKLGFENVYIQELDSSSEEFVPDFDLSGV